MTVQIDDENKVAYDTQQGLPLIHEVMASD